MAGNITTKAAPAGSGNGLQEDHRLGSPTNSNDSTALAQLQESRRRRDLFLDNVETMAEWHEDLTARVARFTLKFTYCDALSPEYEGLVEEVHEFVTVAYALGARRAK